MNILILFATKEGQTEKIAHFIAEVIRHHGHQATTQLGEHLPNDFSTDPFDAAIIGGSIHMGKYPGYLKKFIIEHSDWLNQVPSSFFTVCMAINSANEKEQTEARSFGPNFVKDTNWQPNLIETFAGAVKYTQYGFITRKIMQIISKKEGGNTDTSQDHEYTNWEAVTQFTEQFLAEIKEIEGAS
ncbi:MAG: menaquinone-dependent protoporphyrinogen IX dehydrogenase [Gammaproteobacteria bacterium]|jgi:menaquinone-dependent protoporphyrinogen oxidase